MRGERSLLVPGEAGWAAARAPDPEFDAKRTRCRLSALYWSRILEEVDRCQDQDQDEVG